MGYCETMCQLCGVSFAIARLRRVDEPEEAAWDYTGSEFVSAGEESDGLCGDGSGCTVPEVEGHRAGEHLAGPGCASESGYTGHRISVAEMKGCRAVQCLLQKEDNWLPENDDQDFEIQGEYFLTGIGDGSPDEAPLDNIQPARHGIDSAWILNTVDEEDWGLPFHPTCFEIYKKICENRVGKIDTEGLFYWRLLGCDYQTFFEEFPRDPAIRSAREQWWRHEPGCEYLVANPIEIPGLSQLLKPPAFGAGKSTTFGWNKGPDDDQTESHPTTSSISSIAPDPFSALSADITSMILEHLRSKDIANLRLATPVFRQLPTILFRRLFFEDMPWLFEMKDLDVASVNWYDWYCKWKSSWGDVKGLRNRRRIWRDVEEIVSRIQKFRKEGKISPL